MRYKSLHRYYITKYAFLDNVWNGVKDFGKSLQSPFARWDAGTIDQNTSEADAENNMLTAYQRFQENQQGQHDISRGIDKAFDSLPQNFITRMGRGAAKMFTSNTGAWLYGNRDYNTMKSFFERYPEKKNDPQWQHLFQVEENGKTKFENWGEKNKEKVFDQGVDLAINAVTAPLGGAGGKAVGKVGGKVVGKMLGKGLKAVGTGMVATTAYQMGETPQQNDTSQQNVTKSTPSMSEVSNRFLSGIQNKPGYWQEYYQNYDNIHNYGQQNQTNG